jgi:hypothetical protein
VILIITRPTFGSLANATSSKDRTHIWFLEFMINYQNDPLMLHFFSKKNLVVHLQQQEQDLEMQFVRVRRFAHLNCLTAIGINNYCIHTISNSICVMLALMLLPLKACPHLEITFQLMGKMVMRSCTSRYPNITSSNNCKIVLPMQGRW